MVRQRAARGREYESISICSRVMRSRIRLVRSRRARDCRQPRPRGPQTGLPTSTVDAAATLPRSDARPRRPWARRARSAASTAGPLATWPPVRLPRVTVRASEPVTPRVSRPRRGTCSGCPSPRPAPWPRRPTPHRHEGADHVLERHSVALQEGRPRLCPWSARTTKRSGRGASSAAFLSVLTPVDAVERVERLRASGCRVVRGSRRSR